MLAGFAAFLNDSRPHSRTGDPGFSRKFPVSLHKRNKGAACVNRLAHLRAGAFRPTAKYPVRWRLAINESCVRVLHPAALRSIRVD